ncbi:MAG: HEAT repeat domain-containing protein [Candidatus Sulfotelmatobacter sp.]
MRHRILAGTLILGLCLTVPGVNGQTLLESVDQARSILREGVEAKDPVVRVQAITAVGMIGVHELVLTRLEDLLHDKNIRVRLAAVRALADLASPHSVEPLRRVLQEEKVPEVVFAAAKALEKLHDPAGTKALMEVYEGKRKSSSGMIEKHKRKTTDQFHSVPSGMMFVASQGAGYVPVPGVGEGFSAFAELIHDKGLSDRAGVILILGQSKNPEATDLLRNALHDKDWSVRAAAAQVIARSARVEMRDALLPLFSDKNQKVRFMAAGAFLHLALIQYPQK